jgi:hypothetical protein
MNTEVSISTVSLTISHNAAKLNRFISVIFRSVFGNYQTTHDNQLIFKSKLQKAGQ